MTSVAHDSWHLAETYERVSDLQFADEQLASARERRAGR